MDMTANLPVQKHAYAEECGFATKLVPFFVDGVQTAWKEEHINSKVTEIKTDSVEALHAKGYRVPFVDYDPILDDFTHRDDLSALLKNQASIWATKPMGVQK